MECYEGPTMIKTFRGLIADGGQDTIVLHTNDGSIGYRIVKFQIMTSAPTGSATEHVCKIYKVDQIPPSGSLVNALVDFNDNTLLGTAVWSNAVGYGLEGTMGIIFDGEIFNQDIYVSQTETTGSAACNYYIELEQIKLDLSESTVATLKDIRNEVRTI